MSDIPTLAPVSKENSRRYNEDYADNARAALKRFTDSFPSQQKAADALGVDQGTVSRSLNLANQPSMKVLIALRDRTGQSLDDVLGLPPPKAAPAANDEQIGRLVAHLTKLLPPRSPTAQPAPAPTPGAGRDVEAEVRPSKLPPPKHTRNKKRQ